LRYVVPLAKRAVEFTQWHRSAGLHIVNALLYRRYLLVSPAEST
jgi:hypothetical protein